MLVIQKMFYQTLLVIMLILSIHWLFVSIVGFPAFLLALIIGLGLRFLRREWLEEFFKRLIKHKGILITSAVIFQLLVLLSAKLLIRSDAAVVFQGAIGELPSVDISNYLTRNPNNLALFLYERLFYKLFSGNALWLLQGINLICVNASAYLIYRAGKDFFSQKVADIAFLFYIGLLGFSPYVIAMYTDILGLPFLSLELYLALKMLKQSTFKWRTGALLGLTTAIALLWRSTALIVIVALLMVMFLERSYRRFFKVFLVFALSFGLTFGSFTIMIKRQNEVEILKGEGLAKPVLNFVNLGLTYSGTDQKDMKNGLLQYIPKSKRKDYNNGMFKQTYVVQEIKRRWSEYTWWTFGEHLAYKQAETVNDGTLGWLYQDPSKEKTAYISPLYDKLKDSVWSTKFRELFIERDAPNYYYISAIKQGIWLLLALGLCFISAKKTLSNTSQLLFLATFGGLLFLLIFEGGKGRYLIQFIPQIILLSALGWEVFQRKDFK